MLCHQVTICSPLSFFKKTKQPSNKYACVRVCVCPISTPATSQFFTKAVMNIMPSEATPVQNIISNNHIVKVKVCVVVVTPVLLTIGPELCNKIHSQIIKSQDLVYKNTNTSNNKKLLSVKLFSLDCNTHCMSF